jgi:hypothetical protein
MATDRHTDTLRSNIMNVTKTTTDQVSLSPQHSCAVVDAVKNKHGVRKQQSDDKDSIHHQDVTASSSTATATTTATTATTAYYQNGYSQCSS